MLSCRVILVLLLSALLYACEAPQTATVVTDKSAEEILGHPDYPAISYGGYRGSSRDQQPTVAELKEDLLLLHALGIRIIRTYNVHLPHASNVLQAISEIKSSDPTFEMYVMLGAWINCTGAWTATPDHDSEDEIGNTKELLTAIGLTNQYPDIVKIIAVGNEAMVKWAASYYVQPGIILKYVNELQSLKEIGKLPKDLWITSSDNFASWGGGGEEYHVEDLNDLIKSVDYISMHTYPMHDTHYNPDFWGYEEQEKDLSKKEQIAATMQRAAAYAQDQYLSVKRYMQSIGVDKPIHIGETGWASQSNGFYGVDGSKATDEYKEGFYYQHLRKWTSEENIACFYFEAFDENWKDAANPGGSENHFGLFTIDGQAKYAIWDKVDEGAFQDLGRSSKEIKKTYNGDIDQLLKEVAPPPYKPNSR